MTFGLVYSLFKFEKKKGTETDSLISYAFINYSASTLRVTPKQPQKPASEPP
jgi:hypothetical protein